MYTKNNTLLSDVSWSAYQNSKSNFIIYSQASQTSSKAAYITGNVY